MAQAARIRGEVARLARIRLKAEDTQRRLTNEAERAVVLDLIERLRAAEPEAAAKLIEHVHSRKEGVSLAAIRELFDRTRGRPAQTVATLDLGDSKLLSVAERLTRLRSALASLDPGPEGRLIDAEPVQAVQAVQAVQQPEDGS
jgi:hypothetical protein